MSVKTDFKNVKKRVADLIPYANNARTHSDEQVQQLAASMREFGFTNPVLIDSENGIIAGHGRVLAARLIGLDQIPCIILDGLTEAQRKAYVIADNRLPENAGWNKELLALELKTLDDLSFNLSTLGFEPGELDELLKPEITDGKTNENEVPDITDAPISKPGDLWILGQHKLLCGDGSETASVETLLDGALADLYLTDPPDELNTGKGETSDVELRDFLKRSFTAANHFMKPGAVFYVWFEDSMTYAIRGAANDVGWEVKQSLIWKMQSSKVGRQDYQWIHQACLYGWKPGAKHLWAADRKQNTILSFDRPQKSAQHAKMKPVELFLYQLLNNTKGKDIILDSFGGTGTSIIASEKSDRRCMAIEKDPVLCDMAIARWEEYTGEKAVHSATNKPFKRGTRSKGKPGAKSKAE